MPLLGYGISIPECQLSDDHKILLAKNMDFEPELACDCEYNPEHRRELLRKIDAYYNPQMCTDGIGALITDTLNGKLHNMRRGPMIIFNYEDGKVFVPASIPQDNEWRQAMLTVEEIKTMILGLFGDSTKAGDIRLQYFTIKSPE